MEEIDISYCEFKSGDITAVKNVLEQTQKLSKFSMADCKGINCVEDSFQAMILKLTELPNMETLDLSGVEMGRAGVQKLAKAPHNSKWKHLKYLNRCELTSVPRLFEDMAKGCQKLSELHLAGNRLNKCNLKTLKTFLNASDNLLQLNIGHCKIGDMREFQELLEAAEGSCPKLSKLHLQNKDVLKALKSLVETSSTLVELNIGGQIKECDEFEALLNATGKHSTLQNIGIRQHFMEHIKTKITDVMKKSHRTMLNEMQWDIQ